MQINGKTSIVAVVGKREKSPRVGAHIDHIPNRQDTASLS